LNLPNKKPHSNSHRKRLLKEPFQVQWVPAWTFLTSTEPTLSDI